MLKAFTVESLQKITESSVKNLEFLAHHCPGIFKNEKKKYNNAHDQIEEKDLEESLIKLSQTVIPNLNHAFKNEKTEPLRNALKEYYQTLENIIQYSLTLRLAHEIPFEEGVVGSDPTKGRHLVALQNLIQDCKEARETIYQDHDLREENANCSKLGDAICLSVKHLSSLIGYEIKEQKNQKIVDLINPETHYSTLAKQLKH